MKKVLCEWEKDKGRKGPALFSFHSVSKGLLGECGLRGGYLECYNVPKEITAQIYKCFSVCLCSNTIGQVVVSYMVNPPKSDDEDKKHLKTVFESMERKAQILTEGLNKVPYMTCEVVSGAMYAFPRLYLPKRFVEEAEAGKMAADTLYCLKLLETTGVCGVLETGSSNVRTHSTCASQSWRMRSSSTSLWRRYRRSIKIFGRSMGQTVNVQPTAKR